MVGKWHVGMTFFDREGKPVRDQGLEGVRRVDFSRPAPDGPVHRGFGRFFGTVCCPATDWLYAFVDGDRVPVPPTGPLDRSSLPAHAYSKDNRPGLIAPGFDLQELDTLFLEKSVAFLEDHARRGEDRPFFLFHSTQAVHLPSFAGREFRGRTRAGPHGDFIFEFDAVVGRLLETLDRLGMSKNTLVVVTSDNGPEVSSVVHMRKDHGHDGARPWRGVKRDNWEGGHRVPLIVRWPDRVPAGRVSGQTACLTDLMATCASIVGSPLPGGAAEDSFDLLPAFLGTDGGRPLRPFVLHQTVSLALGIRQGRWKYLDHPGSGGNDYSKGPLVEHAVPESEVGAPGQLYDLDADPGERRNLCFRHPEVVRELKTRLDACVSSGRSAPAR
jgi:arylsulfatase A-like enzyme